MLNERNRFVGELDTGLPDAEKAYLVEKYDSQMKTM
jgi:hypothetical protein